MGAVRLHGTPPRAMGRNGIFNCQVSRRACQPTVVPFTSNYATVMPDAFDAGWVFVEDDKHTGNKGRNAYPARSCPGAAVCSCAGPGVALCNRSDARPRAMSHSATMPFHGAPPHCFGERKKGGDIMGCSNPTISPFALTEVPQGPCHDPGRRKNRIQNPWALISTSWAGSPTSIGWDFPGRLL